MEKNVEVNGKKFIVRELLATDVDDIDFKNPKEVAKKQVQLSTGMSDDEYLKLTFNERKKLIEAINDVNGLGFQSQPQ